MRQRRLGAAGGGMGRGARFAIGAGAGVIAGLLTGLLIKEIGEARVIDSRGRAMLLLLGLPAVMTGLAAGAAAAIPG